MGITKKKSKNVLRTRFNVNSLRGFFFRRAKGKILEIGPFNRPAVKNAVYFDIYDKQGLIAVARDARRDIKGIPEIDYVDPDGNLTVVDEKFNAVVSSHVIEHQPDLIRHLQHVSNLLFDSGLYYLAIPDKRFCFDHFFDVSTPEDIFSAIGRTTHSWETIIRHFSKTTHNNARKHWLGMHSRHLSPHDLSQRELAAKNAFESGKYVDAHAWQFTPRSFIEIVDTIGARVGLVLDEVYETPPFHQEFMACLRKI